MSNTPNPNRIDPTPVRLSTNVSIDRQTPKVDFGDRVKLGLDAATNAVAEGAAYAAPFVPGGAIVSAAVSRVSGMSDGSSSGQANGGVNAGVVSGGGGGGGGVVGQYAYAAGGVTSVPGMGSTDTNLSTTVGGTSLGGIPGSTTTTGSPSVLGTGQTATEVQYSNQMSQMYDQQNRLLRVQMTMQQENQIFSTVSNVLKVRHDTVKNTIANLR